MFLGHHSYFYLFEKESLIDPGPLQFGYSDCPATLRHPPVSVFPVLILKDCEMPKFYQEMPRMLETWNCTAGAWTTEPSPEKLKY